MKLSTLRALIREEILRNIVATEEEGPSEDSPAAKEAKAKGLEHLGWGRYGKGGTVSHVTRDGKLSPVEKSPSKKMSRPTSNAKPNDADSVSAIASKPLDDPYGTGPMSKTPAPIKPSAQFDDPYGNTPSQPPSIQQTKSPVTPSQPPTQNTERKPDEFTPYGLGIHPEKDEYANMARDLVQRSGESPEELFSKMEAVYRTILKSPPIQKYHPDVVNSPAPVTKIKRVSVPPDEQTYYNGSTRRIEMYGKLLHGLHSVERQDRERMDAAERDAEGESDYMAGHYGPDQ